MPPEISCTLAYDVGALPYSLQRMLVWLAPLLIDGPCNDAHIDLTHASASSFGPIAVTILWSIALENSRRGCHARFSFPPSPSEISTFIEVSGLRHRILGGPEPDRSIGHVLPLCQIHEASWNVPTPIIDLVRRFVSLDSDTEDFLRICVNEVVQIVEDHARSAIGVIHSARFRDRADAGQVEVALVDRGIGIQASLQTRYPEIESSTEAINRVLAGGVSARSRQNNMGVGVSNLHSILLQLGGELIIASGDIVAYRAPGKAFDLPLNFSFAGTGVFFTLPVKVAA